MTSGDSVPKAQEFHLNDVQEMMLLEQSCAYVASRLGPKGLKMLAEEAEEAAGEQPRAVDLPTEAIPALRTVLGGSAYDEFCCALTGKMGPAGAELLAQEAAALRSTADYLADEIHDLSPFDGAGFVFFMSVRELRLQAARRLREARIAAPSARADVRYQYRHTRSLNSFE